MYTFQNITLSVLKLFKFDFKFMYMDFCALITIHKMTKICNEYFDQFDDHEFHFVIFKTNLNFQKARILRNVITEKMCVIWGLHLRVGKNKVIFNYPQCVSGNKNSI